MSTGKVFKITGHYWAPKEQKDDVLAHVLNTLPEDVEVVSTLSQVLTDTIVFVNVRVAFEQPEKVWQFGKDLQVAPCQWAHDGLSITKSRR